MTVGTTVAGKYRLKRELGRGGMGSVYEAVHVTTGRHVALKVMRAGKSDEPDDARLTRFQREALAVGRLATQHAVLVYDAGFDDATGQPFLAMELLEGEDVSQLIRRLGPLRPDLAAAVVAQACAGLLRAHEAGIIHRDVKPSNLFLTRGEHGDFIVKILDFGIAKLSRNVDDEVNDGSGTLTQTGMLIGSPHYMSPEQAKGLKTLDPRADIWSLGVVFHKCLSGRTPFDHHTTLGQVIVAVCAEDPVSVQQHAPWVPAELAFVIRRALARDPNMRFQRASEMAEALGPFLRNGPRITDEMLQPLDAATRAQVAVQADDFPSQGTPGTMPHLNATLQMMPAPASSTQVDVVPRVADGDTGTGAASFVSAPSAAPARSSSALRWMLPLVALAAVAGAAIVLVPRMRATTPPAVASAPPSVTPAAAASSAAPRTISARVAVAPPGVHVEVDGKSAAVSDDAVTIEGAVGTVHAVRLSHAGHEAREDVILTDQGPRPAQITVVVPAAPTRSAHAATTRPTPSPVRTPTTSQPKPPAPAKTGSGFDRSFE